MPRAPSGKYLGVLLQEMGRIGEAEIERALEHQRVQGGFFGQALVDLGILSPEELDEGLASQAELPYLVPDPETIDPEVAALMPSSWAQRHNALPIRREDGWLTLLVDSPLKSGLIDELAARTGLSVKLALCSPGLLRETINQVHHLDPVQDRASPVISIEAFWSLATSPPAERWGISVRRHHVLGWIRENGTTRRHHLMHNWLVFLDRLLAPSPSQILPPHGLRQWRASVRPDQSPVAVRVDSLSGPGGHDLVFRPISEPRQSGGQLPGSSQLVRLRQAVGEGPVVIGVHSPRGHAARELVTRLPQLLLEPDHRSVCLLREGVHAISEDILIVSPDEQGEGEELLDFLEQLGLDAVGLEIAPSSRELWDRALGLAPLVMIVFTGLEPDEELPPGINWLLSKTDEAQSDWELV